MTERTHERHAYAGLRRGYEPAAFAPYPELVGPGGKPWRVLDSTDRPWLPSSGVTDMGRRVVYTPLRSDGDAVSRHEMAHVLLSPPRGMPRVRFEPLVLHAVEDARVNLALAAAGLGLAFDAELLAEVRLRLAGELKHRRFAVVLLRAVASLGTNGVAVARAELHAAPPRMRAWAEGWLERVETRLERARRRHGGAAARFRTGLDLARELARDLERRGLLDRPIEAPQLACCVPVPADADEDDCTSIDRLFDSLWESERDRGEDDGPDGPRPGELVVRDVPLPLGRAPAARAIGRRARPAAEGCHLVRPHRWALDRKVFRRPVRWRGGTVLIDTSGSMHLRPRSLEALVDASRGAALVAIYSGRGREGELRVVARGGRRAEEADLAPYGSGNVVDLPALQWLARQAEPRLWVSDGGVTGENDRGSREIRRRCAKVVRQGRIARVASAEEAVRRLTAGRGPGCVSPAARPA